MNDDTRATTLPVRPPGKPAQPIQLNHSVDSATMTGFLEFFREALEPTIEKMLRQVLSAVSPPPQAAGPPLPQTPAMKAVELKPTDQQKAADLRVALLMGKIPEDSGMLIDPQTFARLLGISRAMFYRLQAEQALPAPIQLGRLKKWRLSEILEWVEADCPAQSVWVHMRQASSRTKRK